MYITKDIYVLHVLPVCKDNIIHLMTPSMTPVTSSPTPKSCTCQKARKEIGWETSPQVIRSQNGKTLEISGEIWLWTSKNHNVWLSETLLMSPDPGVERNCFIARVVVDTATSSAILSSRDFSRPRILHARAFQCTGSFGESKTRSTPWKTCYRYILGVSRCCFCLKNLKRLCLHFNPFHYWGMHMFHVARALKLNGDEQISSPSWSDSKKSAQTSKQKLMKHPLSCLQNFTISLSTLVRITDNSATTANMSI